MKKIVFVTPPDARHGFNLAGVGQVVPAQGELRKALLALTADPTVGIVAIDERLAGGAEDDVAAMERGWSGVIMILPAPGKISWLAEDYALRLIRRAVGYQVRLNV